MKSPCYVTPKGQPTKKSLIQVEDVEDVFDVIMKKHINPAIWNPDPVETLDGESMKERFASALKGGRGSGHHQHAGRPGKHGGSLPGKGGARMFSGSMDTYSKYFSDGEWSPERVKIHEEIIAGMFAGKTPVENPVSYVFGGGTASGKSTLIKNGKANLPDNSVIADSDEIKKLLPEYQESMKSGDINGAAIVHEESNHIAKQIMIRAVEGGYNVVLDSTGDNTVESMERKIKILSKNGSRPVRAVYCTVPISVALERNEKRAKSTGRYVPEWVVRGTHSAVSVVLPRLVAAGAFEEVMLYDTDSTSGATLIASAKGSTLTVHDKGAYREFLEKEYTAWSGGKYASSL